MTNEKQLATEALAALSGAQMTDEWRARLKKLMLEIRAALGNHLFSTESPKEEALADASLAFDEFTEAVDTGEMDEALRATAIDKVTAWDATLL